MRKYLPAVVIVGVVLGMLVVPAGANYIETWSDDGDVEGWYTAYGDVTLTHDDTADALDWAVTQGSQSGGDYIAADANASGGHFVGDLSGYSRIEFDLYLDAGAYAPSLELSLLDSLPVPTAEWHYGLATPTAGQWQHYLVPLDGGSGWTKWYGDSWNDLIHGVAETSIYMVYGTNASSGLVDNFAIIVPEPGSLVLGALALAGGIFWRRRRGR